MAWIGWFRQSINQSRVGYPGQSMTFGHTVLRCGHHPRLAHLTTLGQIFLRKPALPTRLARGMTPFGPCLPEAHEAKQRYRRTTTYRRQITAWPPAVGSLRPPLGRFLRFARHRPSFTSRNLLT